MYFAATALFLKKSSVSSFCIPFQPILPDIVSRSPTIIKLTRRELPPLEIKGRVIPVRGHSPVLPAIMMIVCTNSMITIPDATA